MFTGIVQTTGVVRSLESGVLTLDPQEVPGGKPWTIGESVAVNGCCLTVVDASDGLRFDLSEETIRRTSFQRARPGALANLERAMGEGDRFGGHIVQGHVDATGEIVSIRKTDLAWIFRFQAPAEYDRYLIDKGSVCVDGISLTVVEPKDGAFDVWVIPHTFEVTNFRAAQPGDLVNLEFDVIAKYLEKLAQPFLERLLRERSS
ncbi:MAG TPA: riboflavin synthase [Armatimonadetes bacterium]|jgi:riboflavin synthase|nr:riboflavin synthase [Armatimonadota bacterium]MCA1997397.1 riboflavin synthase [Armatimonadota bacterium]HCE00348.1 riboflavin synthase [Armatimonadota bacterium]